MMPIGDDGPRSVDRAFGALLRSLDPATPGDVVAAAVEASWAVARGDAALAVDGPVPGTGDAVAAQLRASRWVDTPDRDLPADPSRPLVLEDGLLYLRRYREYERRLARGLRRLAVQAVSPNRSAAVDALFARLFPDAAAGDRQALAARLALGHALALVTGGPGTGKTTTIARVLALFVAQRLAEGAPPPRIALAAPTGRAAERMAEALRDATARLRDAGVDPVVCDALPATARTLHRLLGARGSDPAFRHDAAHPLQQDIVVVDEASMVDLPLMCKLVEAIPAGGRLLLLGDPDQLPAVEAGDVLAAMVDAASDGRGGASVLQGHRVHLVRGYRVAAGLDVAPLAEAVRAGDAEEAIALLRGDGLSGVQWHDAVADPLAAPALREALLAPWRRLLDAADPLEALRLAAGQRMLTALRAGPSGAVQRNDAIEEALAGPRRERYFHGRLLLVTENSYRHGLFNGDIGVCLRDAAGSPVAWFPGGASGAVRGFHPAALPAHAGAFAMTVHKAQGSEFDTVWLPLPRHDSRVLSRELLYTALTRARRAVHLCASEEIVRATLSRRVERVSGLARRLLDPS